MRNRPHTPIDGIPHVSGRPAAADAVAGRGLVGPLQAHLAHPLPLTPVLEPARARWRVPPPPPGGARRQTRGRRPAQQGVSLLPAPAGPVRSLSASDPA